MHFYPHHIGDFIRETSRLTDSQTMTYLRLLWIYYETEKPLQDNLAILSMKSGSDQGTIELILQAYFHKADGAWTHNRCEAEIAKYHSKADRARSANATRWSKKLLKSDADQNDVRCGSDANQILTKNHDPRTTNQEPESNEEDDFFSSAPVKRFIKPTMEEVEDYAKDVGATRSDGQVMWDHWEAGGWKRGNQQIKCWKAAFRSWQRQGWLPSQKQAALDKPKIDWRNTL